MEKKSEIDKTPELSIEVFEHARTIQLLAVEDFFLKKAAASANFAGWAVIFASSAFGDFVRSHFAAQALYALIDSYKIPEGGETPDVSGSVRIEKVNFSYPARPDVKKIDNNDLKRLCRVHLRNNIALVGQEPVLFKGSIIENVTLGLDGVSVSEVQEACRQANAANFVEAFPLVVQNALNEASHGRTSVTIAHRLSTVRDVDRIYYIENGAVVEYGTHEELIDADGKYALLVKAQQLAKTD
ncbi:hypothetical protein TELCIR_06356 [Teladorsagia circumcincta]|uniref:ABC transporter domain-containing protein n=1 Tax=Teladorsagia circumcincta TaxID=45464 RepID=A0A2G9UN91_TELCI|nr:hypothetical protein TELCIR_06356 [Teladorsagia circumcincta]